jgi:hypothetical protein
MNLKRVLTFLVSFLLIAVITSSQPSSATKPDTGPSIFGEGTFTFLNLIAMRTEHFEFSFDATVNKNGKGRGHAQFNNLTTQTEIEIKLDCVTLSQAEAVMSGRVQHSDDPGFPKHMRVVFAAIDGSQIPVPFADRITPIFGTSIFPGFENDCTVPPLTILLLDSGDIVVQP